MMTYGESGHGLDDFAINPNSNEVVTAGIDAAIEPLRMVVSRQFHCRHILLNVGRQRTSQIGGGIP